MRGQVITLKNQHSATDTESIEGLFRDHHESMYLAAYRVCGNAHDAEDVLQTVFVSLLKRPAGLDIGESPVKYLCRASINAGLDILRKKNRTHLVELDEYNEAGPNTQKAESDLFRANVQRHLRMALSQLNPRAAEIFTLRYFEEFSNSEIATLLNISAGSVAVELHRSRDRLQELLGEFEGEKL